MEKIIVFNSRCPFCEYSQSSFPTENEDKIQVCIECGEEYDSEIYRVSKNHETMV